MPSTPAVPPLDAFEAVTPLEDELRVLIVRELQLSDVSPEQIDPAAPLFGGGLGLDSIDALELAVAIHRAYGVKLEPDHAEQRGALQSIRSLAMFIDTARTRSPSA